MCRTLLLISLAELAYYLAYIIRHFIHAFEHALLIYTQHILL